MGRRPSSVAAESSIFGTAAPSVEVAPESGLSRAAVETKPPKIRATSHAPAVPSDPEAAARAMCLNMLSARAQTRAELAARLRHRNIADDVSARVLDRFAEVGLVDDAAFAAAFVAARHRERGLSRDELSRQLRVKGVDAEAVAAAVADIDAEADRSAARMLVTRKITSMSKLPEHVVGRRLVALLARKGYSPGVCYSVVREVLGEVLEVDCDAPTC